MIDEQLLKIKNRPLALGAVVLLAGLFLGWTFVIKPGLSRISYVSAELGGLSQKETSFHHIANSEKKLAEYKQKLSVTGDKTWLIEQLNLIAEKSVFAILSITPDEKRAVGGGYLDRVSVRIEAEGNFHQLGAFVSQVESLDQFVKISSVDIDSGAMDADSVKIKMGIYKILLSVSLFSPVPGAL